jgi:hypothetical protein
MRHGIKLGKRGDGLTQVMKLLGQVFKNSRIRNIVLLFHHNLSNYPFGFPLRQCHSLQLGGRRGPRLVPGPAAAYVCSCRGPVGLKAGGFLGRSRLRLRKPRTRLPNGRPSVCPGNSGGVGRRRRALS